MSDHISGPRALANPIADITDLYAFPSPERPGNLVLVLNTLPFAKVTDAFSEGLIYRLRVREAIATGGAAPFAPAHAHDHDHDGGHEYRFDIVFDPAVRAEDGTFTQGGSVRTPSGDTVAFQVGDESGIETNGIRVFAGARWDPFILDAPAALKTVSTGQLAFTDPGSIFMDGKNVLGITLEIDAALLGGHTLLAVIGETQTRGVFNVRIERTGRPEVKNLLLAPKQFDQLNRDIEIRDIYNMEDAFHEEEGYGNAYRARLNANLAFWDGLDGKVDWPLVDGVHPLTELVLADFLVVDIAKPYQEHGSFLEIELAAVHGRAHETCGGRALNDDMMDTWFTTFITGGNGPAIRDGVDASSRPSSQTFPYLAAPNPNPPEKPEHH
ncbi:DUF4331 family protein [Microbacterium sp. ASV49]|uniref:DUF4331 family protein n=1 Tax=Microbacterium candidum TaxID=3041922 RepID=A0ABT7MYM3_9MICO|nr:DUF4331 family protein [Microbacterium sp. ASV49]MDL9979541.1 DUF4331 family protein [Microbacterium sp. ASV49]